jgi:2-C-methyl-D-erythritol 2,4-cyclodiphosphate synthase
LAAATSPVRWKPPIVFGRRLNRRFAAKEKWKREMDETSAAPSLRVGLGNDLHRLESGGPLRLGGLDLPGDVHALGHSDADALLHALTDALLGAAALGDIGELFPDTAEENRRRDSAEMLAEAVSRVIGAGWRIENVDCIVMLERPKLSPHKESIRRRIAEILKTTIDRVGLKAKTGEGLGPIGTGKAVAAECVALISAQ